VIAGLARLADESIGDHRDIFGTLLANRAWFGYPEMLDLQVLPEAHRGTRTPNPFITSEELYQLS
jgi:hypothetical protein